MPGGRPTKLTAKVQRDICRHLAEGIPQNFAAQLAGVTPRVVYMWLEKGRAGEEAYVQFLHAVEAARARCVAQGVRAIKKHGQRDWKAWKYLLSVRHPEQFRETRAIEHTGPGGGPIQVERTTKEVSDEDLRAELAKLRGEEP